jgi:lysophospholipid acyltransferase (LPLAT)-like uncharacterized protein
VTLSRGRRLQAAVIGALGMPLIEGLGGTWRWRVHGADHVAAVMATGRAPIYALWHGRILAGTVYLRDRGIVVITSENFDGEWIARIIRRFGYEPARGSTSRGGARALGEMRRALRAGRPTAFTLDGPRGPARVAQPGAVWLASVTSHPIIPLHLEASSYWTVNSWDRHQIPKPGSDVAVAIGPPLDVPRRVGAAGLERARLALEQELRRLELQAAAMVGGRFSTLGVAT